MHSVDSLTTERQNITSLELMERAAQQLTAKIVSIFPDRNIEFVIVCGCGNNGGDGFAVGRMLHGMGYSVECVTPSCFAHYSNDCEANMRAAQKIGIVSIVDNANFIDKFSANTVVVDALFGSGLSRPIEGLCADIISAINEKVSYVVSLDAPSGLPDNDVAQNIKGAVIHAYSTITIESPTISMLVPENDDIVGNLDIVSIGLDKMAINEMQSRYSYTTVSDVCYTLKHRSRYSHKGTYGHALLISGAYGKGGAAVLCARACHRSGVGLVTAHVPMSLYDIMQIATPETMISPDSNSNIIASLPDLTKYSAVGVGPGIGTDKLTVDVLEQLIDTCKVPLVLDADALNILSLNKELIKKLPKETILTPHPKEFERLFGKTSDSIQRLDLLADSAKKYNIIIVLKGAHTAVADVDGNIMFNSTGNPGMATAGSGDVLTGVITSLLAQRYDAITAAVLGVYAHGLSGDIVKEQKGYYGIIASDIIDNLPYAFNRISVRNQK